ncbi:DUF3093 domain-containing protein [Amycolatopsis endophytica]|uniref:DUF3093 domain-containing protein n=1 Tax=Amycolatopsis endophytica TaxID=860233 RepID=A0A853B6B5_9PSEU|nr:DUF3093 domain-containing protein [Amycolatopsis endophytica]NYI90619.1 hypothetical protein [Amycolatopsis endophytica]
MGEEASAAAAVSETTTAESRTRYSERLYLSWWGWPLPLVAAGLLAYEIHLGYPAVPVWLPFVVLVPLMVAWLVTMGRVRIRVTGDELWVGDAHLPLRFVGEVEVVGKDGKRKAMGPELDPAAHVTHRGWVGSLLRVHLTDPADPTPYWVFSTRRPEALAELLRSGK